MHTNAETYTMKRRSIKNASLADADIPGLRRRIKMKVTTVAQEADRFDVGIETIRRAVRGETYRHIKDYLDDEEVLPGARPPVATRNPVEPPAELAEEANRSLHRVLNKADEELEREDIVDKFLDARKKPRNPLDE